ncbi:uncharacterized protein LOC119840133 [Zerene cesonia]|uniref:uncharacterized protein LOC119840133 n=1 Tax=Zerene cesonia TaxID=33412 RepID=UPI0018E4FA83|nr:uncharacterized protein LOC119840133 [Zerene cesonia]
MFRSDDLEWTNNQVIRLINEYKNRPMLWDPNHELFRVQTAKYEAWSEIAQMFDMHVTDLRKKFNSIFASHRREKAKVRFGTHSNWFLYDHLSFLPSHVNNTSKTGSTVVVKTGEDQEGEEDSEIDLDNELDVSHEEIIIKNEPEVTTPPKKVTLYRKPRPRIVRHIVKPKNNERQLSEAMKIIKTSTVSKRKDECDSFGEYIAVSLRKHDERTRSMIKQAINNILFEQEMKKYSSPQFTLVEIEENPLIIGDGDAECDK